MREGVARAFAAEQKTRRVRATALVERTTSQRFFRTEAERAVEVSPFSCSPGPTLVFG
jgi:hypothetical protein